MAFHVPPRFAHFRNHIPLIEAAFAFDKINRTTYPDMAERIRLKESLIHRMSITIKSRDIPLILAFVAPGHGLKAAFLRQIGEEADPGILLEAIEKIASDTEPVIADLNLKWQIIRAYRNLHIRFLDDPDILISAKTSMPFLSAGADAALLTGIESFKEKLGIG